MSEQRSPIATDKAIAALPLPEKGQKIFYDGALPGFGVRVTSAGSRTFILNYRSRRTGRERRYSIGACDRWRVTAARKEAERLRKIIDLGGDPLGDLEDERAAAAEEKLRSKLVSALCDEFEEQHLPSLRPATRKFYRLSLKNHVRPALGKKRIEEVTSDDVESLHKALTARGQRHQANQVVTLVGVLFKYAMKLRWRTGDNPARDIEKHTLEGRERYLTPAETKRLAQAVDKLEDKQAAAIIWVLMLTGSRIGETLRMRWDQIDFHRALWTKPSATTKQKRIHHLPLSAGVLTILTALRDQQEVPTSPWVFPGRSREGHRNDLRLAWETALKEAKITNLRIHDLRHSFASTLAGGGFSLPLIGAALGHSRIETTARYAHLANDPLRHVMTRAADMIEAVINGEPAEVIQGKFGKTGTASGRS